MTRNRTKKELIDEIHVLRERVRELEASEVESGRALELCMASEKRMRRMADSMPVLISYVDADRRYRFNNKAYEELFGLSRNELYNRHIEDILGEAIYHELSEYIEKAFSGKEIFFEKSYNFGGEEVYLRVSYVPDFREGGKVEGIFVSGYDITQRVKSEEALKLYAKRLAEIEEAQKQRLAKELHDQVGQRLSAIGMSLNTVSARLSDDDRALRSMVDDSYMLLEQITECVRDIMTDLRPSILDDFGLAAALRWYGKIFSLRTGIEVDLHCEDSDPRLSLELKNTLFRIAQEALTNVAKHSGASKVRIALRKKNKTLKFVLKDNGNGFEPENLSKPGKQRGMGTLIMSERAQASGGVFRIESLPGQGTAVIIEIKV